MCFWNLEWYRLLDLSIYRDPSNIANVNDWLFTIVLVVKLDLIFHKENVLVAEKFLYFLIWLTYDVTVSFILTFNELNIDHSCTSWVKVAVNFHFVLVYALELLLICSEFESTFLVIWHELAIRTLEAKLLFSTHMWR